MAGLIVAYFFGPPCILFWVGVQRTRCACLAIEFPVSSLSWFHEIIAVRSNSELLDAAINSRSHGRVSVRQQLRMLMNAHKLRCCSIRSRHFQLVGWIGKKRHYLHGYALRHLFHSTTSKAMVIVWRKYYQNCFILPMCYLSSISTVNNNSSRAR